MTHVIMLQSFMTYVIMLLSFKTKFGISIEGIEHSFPQPQTNSITIQPILQLVIYYVIT